MCVLLNRISKNERKMHRKVSYNVWCKHQASYTQSTCFIDLSMNEKTAGTYILLYLCILRTCVLLLRSYENTEIIQIAPLIHIECVTVNGCILQIWYIVNRHVISGNVVSMLKIANICAYIFDICGNKYSKIISIFSRKRNVMRNKLSITRWYMFCARM